MDLEGVEEKKGEAEKRIMAYHKRITQAYNRTVKPRQFKEGDLVLRVVEHVRRQISGSSKFAPQWEGPFIVKKAYQSGYYLLVSHSGVLMSPINGKWLKLYHS